MKKNHLYLILGCFLIACQASPTQAPPPSDSFIPTVQVAVAQQKQIATAIHATGKVLPKQEIKLGFPIGGILTQVSARAGQQVNTGQVLARLDAGELATRETQAQLVLDQTMRARTRANNLFEDSVITREQLEQAQTAVKNAEAEVKLTQWYTDKTVLRAPRRGIILKRMAEVSEQVGPGQAVYVFSASRNAWVIRVSITAQELTQIRVGDSASINLSAYPEAPIPSYVEEISQIADPYTGMFDLDLPIRSSVSLGSGFLGAADVFPTSDQLSWILPVDALQISPSGDTYVWSVVDGQAKKVFVDSQNILNDQLIVSEGISSPIQVIVSDVGQLREGDTVKIEE